MEDKQICFLYTIKDHTSNFIKCNKELIEHTFLRLKSVSELETNLIQLIC